MPPTDSQIGQMLMFGFHGAFPNETAQIIADIKKFNLGGVWLTDNNSPMGETIGNIASASQVRKLTSDLQAASQTPLFIAIDAEGGQVIRLKEQYGFPPTHSAQYLGKKNDLVLTKASYSAIARQLKELGINFNFAPVVDLNLAPKNPALGGKQRCFSDDPQTVIVHARVAIEAHHTMKIITCLKHFPGHGSAKDDSHLGMVDITSTWQPDELTPFKILIDEGRAEAVLVAHVIHTKIDSLYPASLSAEFIQNKLQDKLGFDGLVVSDDLNMGAIENHFSHKETLEQAINAGTDLLVFSNLHPYRSDFVAKTIYRIKELLKDDRISEKRISDACSKIRKFKHKYGLL